MGCYGVFRVKGHEDGGGADVRLMFGRVTGMLGKGK